MVIIKSSTLFTWVHNRSSQRFDTGPITKIPIEKLLIAHLNTNRQPCSSANVYHSAIRWAPTMAHTYKHPRSLSISSPLAAHRPIACSEPWHHQPSRKRRGSMKAILQKYEKLVLLIAEFTRQSRGTTRHSQEPPQRPTHSKEH